MLRDQSNDTREDRGYDDAQATPQHNARLADVLGADGPLGLGERCRFPRANPCDEPPGKIGSFNPKLTYYAASIAPNGERRACDWLALAGYYPFVPSRIVERRHAGRRSLVRRPVFPGYAFVGKGKALSWHGILREPGVASLVSAGAKPIELPLWQMRLLAAADEFDAYEVPKDHATFVLGQRVKLIGDLWGGLIGEVMRAPEGRRISVLLDARGRKQKLDIDVDMLVGA